jgi:hypothetical protein
LHVATTYHHVTGRTGPSWCRSSRSTGCWISGAATFIYHPDHAFLGYRLMCFAHFVRGGDWRRSSVPLWPR